MKPPIPHGHLARFGVFELNLRARELRNNGNSVGLPEQSVKILAMLLEKPGEVVLREEIRKRLWPNDTVVEFDHSINAAVKRLRQALGDSPDDPHFIETLARRGYRWKIPVEWTDAQGDAEARAEMGGNPSQTPTDGSLIGKKVSHYRVLEILGGGGMGVIYKAEDLKLGRRVALKFLPEEVASERSALERFEREARAASALNHPNICAIYEFGEHEGVPFIVMELLEGQTLRERIGAQPPQPGKPLPTGELLDFAIQVTRGLEAAHQRGIVHRDIKPANIFITNRGEAKILDFGVAKLVHAEGQPDEAVHPESLDDALPFDLSSALNLTKTGTTVGTASYMSPEQVRGEKLDARTDIFSFGLVLYEMATGQQAFAGDTAVVIREAILHRSVLTARELNPQLSAKLDEVIGRALEKDRNLRYQHASQICADLLRQKRDAPFMHRRWPMFVMAAFVVVVVAGVLFRDTKHETPPSIPLLKEVQLTTNTSENRIEAAAISPDGKYLAYTDAKGMHVKIIETGEIKNIPEPETLKDVKVHWDIPGWFPDSARFIANAHPPGPDQWNGTSRTTSVWIVSLLDGPPQKLRDHAIAYSVSPDGSLISFGTNPSRFADREIWQMGPSGEQAHKLYDTDENSAIGGLYWSPDGKLVIYDKTDTSGDTIVSRDSRGGPPTTILSPSETAGVNDYNWLSDGRLMYALPGEGASGETCNYWALRIDLQTGQRIGKPTQITNWPGFCLGSLTATADEKRIAFIKWVPRKAISIANLSGNGRQIGKPSGVASSTAYDFLGDWTADSTAIVFASDRNGHPGIFKQSVSEDSVQTLVFGPEADVRDPVVSPDGAWVLYSSSAKRGAPRESVMRVPVTGGAAQLVLIAGDERSQNWAMLRCAKSPSGSCVMAERDGDRPTAVLTAFDPLKGRGSELMRFDLDLPELGWLWDLSPDGSRIAFCKNRKGPIYIFSLDNHTTKEIRVKGWSTLQSLDWAADGKGFFVSNALPKGYALLHVDLKGDAQVLLQQPGGVESFGRASRDGRHLAIEAGTVDGNVWTLENF